jgi:hypothetical protein
MAQAATGGPAAGASSPGQIPPAGWFQILKRTYAESTKDNVNLVAAGVAFYAFLAFVPLLGALVLSYGLVAEPASVVQHVQGLTSVMPAEAAKLIGEQLLSISQTATSKKGFGLLLAILVSLYGAMRGATSIITALNIVYGVEEDRGFVKTTLLAIAITVGAVVAMIVGMTAVSRWAWSNGCCLSPRRWSTPCSRSLPGWRPRRWSASSSHWSTVTRPTARIRNGRGSPRARSRRPCCGSRRRSASASTCPISAATTPLTAHWAPSWCS